jgi:hypothetical protein
MNSHGTFEKIVGDDSRDLEGYQTVNIEDHSTSSPSAPKKTFGYGLLALPVVAILSGLAVISQGTLHQTCKIYIY